VAKPRQPNSAIIVKDTEHSQKSCC